MVHPSEPDDDFPIVDDDLSTKQLVRKLRHSIPKEYQASADLRIQWLWSQRLAVVQSISVNSKDVLDVLAAKLMLSAVMMRHLPSIELVLQRLEGAAVTDEAMTDTGGLPV